MSKTGIGNKIYAKVVELADTLRSERSLRLGGRGSTPLFGICLKISSFLVKLIYEKWCAPFLYVIL